MRYPSYRRLDPSCLPPPSWAGVPRPPFAAPDESVVTFRGSALGEERWVGLMSRRWSRLSLREPLTRSGCTPGLRILAPGNVLSCPLSRAAEDFCVISVIPGGDAERQASPGRLRSAVSTPGLTMHVPMREVVPLQTHAAGAGASPCRRRRCDTLEPPLSPPPHVRVCRRRESCRGSVPAGRPWSRRRIVVCCGLCLDRRGHRAASLRCGAAGGERTSAHSAVWVGSETVREPQEAPERSMERWNRPESDWLFPNGAVWLERRATDGPRHRPGRCSIAAGAALV